MMNEAEAIAKYGTPESVDRAESLRAIGKRDKVHPMDVWSYRLSSREAADEFRFGNLRDHGHPTLGIYEEEDGGWVTVLDLRPSLVADGREITDPSEPDD